MMSPGATVLLRRLSGSSTRLTVAVISILICPQIALVGAQATPTTRASVSGSPSFVKIPIRCNQCGSVPCSKSLWSGRGQSAIIKAMKTKFLVLAVLVFVFVKPVFAVEPPPDGGYPNGNTAEGQD